MHNLFKKLADPYLVARIQRACGVRPAVTTDADGNKSREAGIAGRVTVGLTDKLTPIESNLQTHSDSNHNSELRARHQNGNSAQYDKNKISDSQQQNGTSSTSRDVDLNGPTNTADTHSAKPTGDHQNLDCEGVTPTEFFHIDNKLLHTILSLGAELGNESFYILFYPYFFWNLDGWMARRVCWFWCLFMYVGQAAKDIIKWPRPAAPPVFRLEKKYAFEYGMPSTHATVGVGLPFLTYILTFQRYKFNWMVGLAGTLFWCAIVCFSRLYLGMHSVLDVLAGITLASVLLPIWLYIQNPLDDFVLHHWIAPILSLLVPFMACLLYPKLEQWSTARSDTTLVLGVGAGVAVSHWINLQHGLMFQQTDPGPFPIPPLTLELLQEHMIRMVVGGVLALITRAVMKFVTYRGSCWWFKLDPHNPLTKRQLCVELPVKFITYVILSLVVVVVTPVLFTHLNIGRKSFYTEL